MNLFDIPSDNEITLQRLHCEISIKLKNENNMIQYPHPEKKKLNVCFALMPQGNSRSSNMSKSKVMQEIIEFSNTTNDDDDKEFVQQLTCITHKYSDDDVYSRTPKITTLH